MARKKNIRVGFLAIAVCVLLALCALPCDATTVYPGDQLDLSTADLYIIVRGTLNLYPGAHVEYFIWAFSGAINIHGGDLGDSESEFIGDWGYIWILGGYNDGGTDYPPPVVTVYGTNFDVQVYDWELDLFHDVPLGSSDTQFVGLPGDLILLTGNYMDGSNIHLLFDFYDGGIIYLNSPPVTTMTIDIKPGSDTNPINLKSKGLIPVAVLTAGDFVAATVDPETVLLEGVPPIRWTMEDVDGDGDEDMLFHFKTEDLAKVLTEDSTEITLTAQLVGPPTTQSTGQTSSGTTVSGTDEVQILRSKSKK